MSATADAPTGISTTIPTTTLETAWLVDHEHLNPPLGKLSLYHHSVDQDTRLSHPVMEPVLVTSRFNLLIRLFLGSVICICPISVTTRAVNFSCFYNIILTRNTESKLNRKKFDVFKFRNSLKALSINSYEL